ncbi:heavy-metal-associated domain-containing protein [Arthrobacter sulfonylureivorans]|uniref:heavy-metal-associated domain-containing protein n=1 Tax=Arthrobacter sulfonylureivorans TaxID=2486855 RepID=UPI0039E6E6B0
MCGAGNRELPLIDVSSPSCACCAPVDAEKAEEPTSVAALKGASAGVPFHAEYRVAGMTCGHCSSTVAGALIGLDGVTDVQVVLVPGGVSSVSITAAQPVAEAEVREAVVEAGYQLATS